MRLSPVAGEATLSVYVKLVAAMLSWGGTWVAGRVVAQAVTTPIAAAAARFTLAALVLGAVMLVAGNLFADLLLKLTDPRITLD